LTIELVSAQAVENKKQMKIIPCGTEHFEELVDFVVRLNSDGAYHIGYFGEGEADVHSSLAECVVPPAEGFQLAYENEKLVGVFGVDADPEIRRAWLLGPVIEHDDWQAVADQLYSAIQPAIPNGVREQELFCDVNNVNLHRFAERHDFSPRSQTAIFYLLRNAYKRTAKDKTKIMDFQVAYLEQFEHLHDQVFPNTYHTAKQLVEKQDDQHRLLIAVEDDRLIGYLFGKVESESGYVDFIGTHESFRGRGVGADLLAAGLDWMFAAPSTQNVKLTVNADNTAARSLYNKFGFTSGRITRGYRKKINV
jgi:ribosomal protein S18 acetylase RimI-like enzyme